MPGRLPLPGSRPASAVPHSRLNAHRRGGTRAKAGTSSGRALRPSPFRDASFPRPRRQRCGRPARRRLCCVLATLPGWRDWLFSVRSFAAAMLALWLALWHDLPRPYWAVGTVYIVIQPLSGALRAKALARFLGTLAGAAFAVAAVPNRVDAPPLLILVLALWVAGCTMGALYDPTPRSYAFRLAGYTAALIAFP